MMPGSSGEPSDAYPKPIVLERQSDMTAKEIEVCKEALEQKLDKKFAIEHKVDESLIGGVVLKFGTMMYDASVRTVLQRVRELRV